ncbi:MAG: hypothetical protein QM731_06980 [Chitinophagaceae bacterium]
MKKIIIAILVLISVECMGQRWTAYQLGNGIAIKFPEKPTERQVDLSRKTYSVVQELCSFAVLVTTVEPERVPQNSEDEIRILNIVSQRDEAKEANLLISEGRFKIGDKEGLDIIKYIVNPDTKQKVKVHMRAFFYKDTLYQFSTMDISDNNKEVSNAEKLFFDSLTK